MAASLLSRESTVAPPGYNRSARSAGRLGRASGDRPGLRVLRVQPAAHQADRHRPFGPRRLEHQRGSLDLLDRHRDPRSGGRPIRPVGGTGGSSQGDVRRRPVLRRRLHRRSDRRALPHAAPDLPGVRCPRRLRSRHRLHLAGIDAHQMVPRPPGRCHRAGHHGLRGRRPRSPHRSR